MRIPIKILRIIIIAISLVFNLERGQLIIITNMIENIVSMLMNDSWIFSLMGYSLILLLNPLTLVILHLYFQVQLLDQLLKLINSFTFLYVLIHYIFQILSNLIISQFKFLALIFALNHFLQT